MAATPFLGGGLRMALDGRFFHCRFGMQLAICSSVELWQHRVEGLHLVYISSGASDALRATAFDCSVSG